MTKYDNEHEAIEFAEKERDYELSKTPWQKLTELFNRTDTYDDGQGRRFDILDSELQ